MYPGTSCAGPAPFHPFDLRAPHAFSELNSKPTAIARHSPRPLIALTRAEVAQAKHARQGAGSEERETGVIFARENCTRTHAQPIPIMGEKLNTVCPRKYSKLEDRAAFSFESRSPRNHPSSEALLLLLLLLLLLSVAVCLLLSVALLTGLF